MGSNAVLDHNGFHCIDKNTLFKTSSNVFLSLNGFNLCGVMQNNHPHQKHIWTKRPLLMYKYKYKEKLIRRLKSDDLCGQTHFLLLLQDLVILQLINLMDVLHDNRSVHLRKTCMHKYTVEWDQWRLFIVYCKKKRNTKKIWQHVVARYLP